MTMPAPIPIARMPQASSSNNQNDLLLGSSRLGNSYGASFLSSSNNGGSASFREAMALATSFGKDANDLMDYSMIKFGSSVDSEMTIAPSTSFGQQAEVESSFCRNFNCCNLQLNDLHDLLQHYEEAHVRFDDDGMPGMVEDDGTSSGGSVSTPSSMPPSPRSANARNAKLGLDGKRRTAGLTIQTDGSSSNASDMSSPTMGKGKKRSFGQYDAATNQPAGGASVHQSLRRALIDGGVGGRGNRASPSIYSANSPFSTPGSSIPGTPLCEDGEFAFGNNGLSAFSSLSLRPVHGDDHLPACAPPNLFFPAPGSSSTMGANATTVGHPALNALPSTGGTSQPPAKRERISSTGGEKLDKDGKPVDKPFKCPNPGCDKAYKQANGLKYHRLHGSCNKNLSVDGDAATTSASPSTTSPTAPKAASPATPSPAAATAVNASPAPSRPAAQVPSSATASNNATQQTKPAQSSISTAANSAVRPPQGAFPQQASGLSQQPSRPGVPNAGASKPVTNPSPANGSAGQSNSVGNAPKPSTGAPANANKPAAFPLPGNINSAALAAATALLQRGGPLPPSIQGQHGPIDSAALLKTLQMLQQQMAQQQQQQSKASPQGLNKGLNTGNAQNNVPGVMRPPQQQTSAAARPAANTAGPNAASSGTAGAGAAKPNGMPSQAPSSNAGTPANSSQPRTSNLTNTQPGGSPNTKPNLPAGQATGGLTASARNAPGSNVAKPAAPGANGATAPAQSSTNGTPAQTAKATNVTSGITPQMLAAAQQAAAQKRAQQAGANRSG